MAAYRMSLEISAAGGGRPRQRRLATRHVDELPCMGRWPSRQLAASAGLVAQGVRRAFRMRDYGLFVSAQDQQFLAQLRGKIGGETLPNRSVRETTLVGAMRVARPGRARSAD